MKPETFIKYEKEKLSNKAKPVNTKIIHKDTIKPTAKDCLCKVTFTKSLEGLWTVDVTEYLITPRDKNEIMRQLKIWFRRYLRTNILNNSRKRREAAEKEALNV